GDGSVRRQRDDESGATRRHALEVDRAPHGVDQPLANRQPEAASLAAVALRISQLEELVEDVRVMLGRNALSGIRDAELDRSLAELRRNLHRARVRELDRVLD